MNTIQGKWEQYKSKVVPKDADAVLEKHIKDAFYAGALSLFGVVGETTNGPDLSDDAVMAIMDGCFAEIGSYFHLTTDTNTGSAPVTYQS